MDLHKNIPLKNYTTMRLGGPAKFMTQISTSEMAREVVKNALEANLPWFVLGGGSNVIARDDGFDGVVIFNKIPGFEVIERSPGSVTIKIGAGETWDDVVKRSVEMGLSGIEAMSAIPGTAGAAPVQNVGAYGQEIADTLLSLEAYDTVTDRFVVLRSDECGFSYRHSIFRGEFQGRYIITSITIRLSTTAPQPPFYAALQNYFDEHDTTIFTPQIVRDAVMAIRFEKLPDPTVQPNTGSFFKNAIVDQWQFDALSKDYPDMPHYDMPDKQVKIPTGWLIEQAGFKGQTLHGMHIHDKNALVLINESAKNYSDLAAARDEIIGGVRDKFRILISQEPLEI